MGRTTGFFVLVAFIGTVLPLSVPAQERVLPGFGVVSPVDADNWYRSNYGFLYFPDIEADPELAWSDSFQVWLQFDRGGIFGGVYGWMWTDGDLLQTVYSSTMGWINFNELRAYFGWLLGTERFGWIFPVNSGTSMTLWLDRIKGWGILNPDQSLFSYDYGLLKPTDDPNIFYSTVFGRVTIGWPYDGYVYVDNLGTLMADRDSEGRAFWNVERQEWLILNEDGQLYAWDAGEYIPFSPVRRQWTEEADSSNPSVGPTGSSGTLQGDGSVGGSVTVGAGGVLDFSNVSIGSGGFLTGGNLVVDGGLGTGSSVTAVGGDELTLD